MNTPERQPRIEFHPANWEVITDERHRMMDVRSVLACARYALLNENTIDVEGAITIAHDVLNDIIDKLDSVAFDAATKKWLADHERPSTNKD